MPAPLLVTFAAGNTGPWRIDSMRAVQGPNLAIAPRLSISEGLARESSPAAAWTLKGVTSHLRYTTSGEKRAMESVQEGLGRPRATCAALIPIRKSESWWALAQNERREIFEARSRHIAIGQAYLPAIARRLHHCRDLGEPFDFLTWFEFAPQHTADFDRMLGELRATEEWRHVEREVDIRVVRGD